MIHVNEFGHIFRLQTDFDLTSNTSVGIEITKPDNTTATVAGAVGTGTGTATNDSTDSGEDIILETNQHILATVTATDMFLNPGTYRVRGLYVDATKELFTDKLRFKVST